MEAKKYVEMLHDSAFHDLKKMTYKYNPADVEEMLCLLKIMGYQELPLLDFSGKPMVINTAVPSVPDNRPAKALLSYKGQEAYSIKTLEDEIISTLQIENINTSRESVREILAGKAARNDEQERITGLKRGFEFIADLKNNITESNLRKLYGIAINPYLSDKENMLRYNQLYRDSGVVVLNTLQEKKLHHGLDSRYIKRNMDSMFTFISDESSGMSDLDKASVIHFYMGYVHPYFDGNGRMARLLHLWFLIQKGYTAALFMPFSALIEKSRSKYSKAYELVEGNYKISGTTDVSPFLAYFNNCIYQKIGENTLVNSAVEDFSILLADGKITEKEKQLFHFVLSFYGEGEFSTKQLEKDFGRCAYATIRAFVLKLTKEGILAEHIYSNRKKYSVAPAAAARKLYCTQKGEA